MTYKEKLLQEHPEIDFDNANFHDCPDTYGYEVCWDCLGTDMVCDKCWNREIPELEGGE